MATNKTSKKRSQFIEFIKAGYTPLECARLAGYSSPENNYVKVLNHPDVQAVIEEMRVEAENRRMYTKTDAINDLKEALRLAKLKGDGLAMRHCIAELAKLLDLYKLEEKKGKKVDVDTRKRIQDYELAKEEDLLAALGGEEAVVTDVDPEEDMPDV